MRVSIKEEAKRTRFVLNEDYAVLAVHIFIEDLIFKFYLEDDYSMKFHYGIYLSGDEINLVDTSIPKEWIVKLTENNSIILSTQEYIDFEYFQDCVTDGEPAAVAVFKRLMKIAGSAPYI